MAEKNWLDRYAGNSLLVALVGLLGVVLGLFITPWLTKRTMLAEQEAQRSRGLETQRLEFKKQAYTDFLKGQTLLQQGPEKEQEAKQFIIDSKLRLILLGSDKVLCSMTEYWAIKHQYKECTDVDEKRRDAAIYRHMRQEFFRTLGAPESAEIDDRILVPYLRECVLPGEPTINQVCKSL